MKTPLYVPLIGADPQQVAANGDPQRTGLIAIATAGQITFPGCPVTGEATDRTFPVRDTFCRFDHPVSQRGSRRLQFEYLRTQVLNGLVGMTPCFYGAGLMLFYAVTNTLVVAWGWHVLIAVGLMFAVRWAFAKYLPPTVTIQSKAPGIVILKYRDHAYAAALHELNRPPTPVAPNPTVS